jgi:hypothetical protein
MPSYEEKRELIKAMKNMEADAIHRSATDPSALADYQRIQAERVALEMEARELAKLPDDAEIEIIPIGTIDDGIDGSDEYVLMIRKDDDMTLEQAHNHLLPLYYRECTRPGGYFCTRVSVVHAEYSQNRVIGTIHHSYDV